MTSTDRLYGTFRIRTHDPRIMSPHSDMLTRICWPCFMPFRPGSTGRCVRCVPLGFVPCQRYRSHGPPAIAAGVGARVPPMWRTDGRVVSGDAAM